MFELLKTFSWQELRHHPWRNAAALLAIMLGVALAFSVHLINASALNEFSQAARSVSGQSDLELRAVHGHFDEQIYAKIARHPAVLLAAPVLENHSFILSAQGKRALRVIGVDALSSATIAPDLLPQLNANQASPDSSRWDLFAPNKVFLNAAAKRLLLPNLNSSQHGVQSVKIQSGMRWLEVAVAGTVAASGPALAVMDIGAAQELFGQIGQLSRIDLRLQPGVDRQALARQLQADGNWPPDVSVTLPQDSQAQINNLSRAYRVNLLVLALIALFTGAFLVFSVLSLSVAKRAQQFALLGVLGLSARQRLQLVLLESLVLGTVGSLAGLALGLGLAVLALGALGGDLGGGFFSGAAPELRFSFGAALIYGALGIGAALVGSWWPARAAQQLPPAATLKGLGQIGTGSSTHWPSFLLLISAAALTMAPPIFGMALGAYLAISLLLLGGIAALPWLIALLLDCLAPKVQQHTLLLLALERARRQRNTASIAVSGVVAALSLAVALTVMVASFRTSVDEWLAQLLPADVYVRSATSKDSNDTVFFSPEFVRAAAKLPGVKKLQVQRNLNLTLQSDLPPVVLLARSLPNPARNLPLLAAPLPVPAGQIGVYVSEAVLDLHAAKVGQPLASLGQALRSWTPPKSAAPVFFVAGAWRDYARQSGAIAIDLTDFQRLTKDERANDLALWLEQPSDAAPVRQALEQLANPNANPQHGQNQDSLSFNTTAQIRALSLSMFDRSFAVTYWLQAVAIAIGLFGIAASFSAQVLARRKEFGLLAHLGLTKRQILSLVALEGLTWTTLGALTGLGLGLIVALILVKIVNPQSFHWSMDLMLPWLKLLTLGLAVVGAGSLTAWLAARASASHEAVLAVKEDW